MQPLIWLRFPWLGWCPRICLVYCIDAKPDFLLSSDKIFAKELFEDYLVCFTIHCIIVYTDQFEHPNPKFTLTVELLFNWPRCGNQIKKLFPVQIAGNIKKAGNEYKKYTQLRSRLMPWNDACLMKPLVWLFGGFVTCIAPVKSFLILLMFIFNTLNSRKNNFQNDCQFNYHCDKFNDIKKWKKRLSY